MQGPAAHILFGGIEPVNVGEPPNPEPLRCSAGGRRLFRVENVHKTRFHFYT